MARFDRLLQQGAASLEAAGIENPRREARRLLAAVMEVDEASLLAAPECELDEVQTLKVLEALAKRVAGMPLSRILGVREFWSLPFKVTAAVLDPRPDSETLIEAALSPIADRQAGLRALDLGTGSGCLLLALLSELPRSTGLGVDSSASALAVAQENAVALGLGVRAAFRCGDWGAGIEERFDIILCNPPYLGTAEYRRLDRSVAGYDPRAALVPGEGWRPGFEASGLEAYQTLLPDLPRLMKPDGYAFLEIGWRQAEAVSALAVAAGFAAPEVLSDLAGRPRCIVLA